MKTLRNISILMATLVLVVSFSACKKEGVYNPSKKIAAIYRTMEEEPVYKAASKELIATYVWDGKLLSQIIEYYADSYTTYTYKYNKQKQLIEVDMESEGLVRIEYDGKNVDEVSLSIDGEDMLDVEYIRKGNQIIGADVEISTELIEEFFMKKHSHAIDNVLSTFLPFQMDKAFTQTMEKYAQHYSTDSKGSLKGHIDYEWSGKNVAKADFKLSILFYSVQITSIYEYDNKINPFNGGMMTNATVDSDIIGLFHDWMNVNNVTKSTMAMNIDGEAETETTTCTYEYDNDDYPVKVITQDAYGPQEDFYEYK